MSHGKKATESGKEKKNAPGPVSQQFLKLIYTIFLNFVYFCCCRRRMFADSLATVLRRTGKNGNTHDNSDEWKRTYEKKKIEMTKWYESK